VGTGNQAAKRKKIESDLEVGVHISRGFCEETDGAGFLQPGVELGSGRLEQGVAEPPPIDARSAARQGHGVQDDDR
jgi:hypothetical protein